MGIERFIARRGTPSVIWSDNGTNFVGAEKELLNVSSRGTDKQPQSWPKKVLNGNLTPRQPHITVVLGNVSFGVVKGYSTR